MARYYAKHRDNFTFTKFTASTFSVTFPGAVNCKQNYNYGIC
jgi:hypothetical protein